MSFIPRTAFIFSVMYRIRESDGRPISARWMHSLVARRGLFRVMVGDVLFDDLLKFAGDIVAFQRHRLGAVHVHRRDRILARTGEADTDIGMLAFARTIDDTPHNSD